MIITVIIILVIVIIVIVIIVASDSAKPCTGAIGRRISEGLVRNHHSHSIGPLACSTRLVFVSLFTIDVTMILNESLYTRERLVKLSQITN